MEILFITFNSTTNPKSGGEQCSAQNLSGISVYGNVDEIKITHTSKIFSLFSLINLFFPPFNIFHFREIDQKLQKKKYDLIYFDSSLFGVLVKKISKKHNLKKIVFFHNVEFDYIDVRFGRNPIKYAFRILAKFNEHKSLKYSDLSICLSLRDQERLYSIYNERVEYIFPISMPDSFENERVPISENENTKKSCLFVGSNIKPNRDGIFWFINNVLDKIDYDLVIVGRGFEEIQQEIRSKKVKIIGTVDDLSIYYANAHFVVSPIFEGAGMKVKVAEALMYGKYVFGTSESFIGYDLETHLVGGQCDNDKEFIQKINYFDLEKKNKFNDYSRDVFLKKYSNEAFVKNYVFLQNLTSTTV